VLTLSQKGHGKKKIAQTLSMSINSVRKILADGRKDVPPLLRDERLAPHAERVQALFVTCRGNLVRVHEELLAENIDVPYSTLTGFCCKYGIGVPEKRPAGQYHFEPAEEMQHDTSPHDVCIDGKMRRVQCASVVLCHSRLLYAQVYPTFNRFYCKLFLTEALIYFQGAAGRCMVDNTNVVVACGTGANAVIAPEMEAFAERFGFRFVAHEKGDANRSARVERPFHYIEHNFYAGRTFTGMKDVNVQLRDWCDKVAATPKRTLNARPIDLYQTEALALRPLPLHIPEVYAVHIRAVNLEGYITLHTNRYSVPARHIGDSLTVHEGRDTLRIYRGHELVATHVRHEDNAVAWATVPGHREFSRWRKGGEVLPPIPEEGVLRAASPVLKQFVETLRSRESGRAIRHLRHLHRLYIDYPLVPLETALVCALEHGLYDLNRIERMVLKNVAGNYFRLASGSRDDSEEKCDG
jgi:hypothetical protein